MSGHDALRAALDDAEAYLRLAVTWIEDSERRGKMKDAAERARAALAVREEPQGEQELRDALADALLWLERIPPPEEETRALGRGLWDETLEKGRTLLAAREDTERPDEEKLREALRAIVDLAPAEPNSLMRRAQDIALVALRDTERPDDPKAELCGNCAHRRSKHGGPAPGGPGRCSVVNCECTHYGVRDTERPDEVERLREGLERALDVSFIVGLLRVRAGKTDDAELADWGERLKGQLVAIREVLSPGTAAAMAELRDTEQEPEL